MKATQQQRLMLALQAAANIVPVQFQIEHRYFSPAIRPWRIIASGLTFVVLVSLVMFGLTVTVLFGTLIALPVACLFFRSFLSVRVWPRRLIRRVMLTGHNSQPQPIDGEAKIVIMSSQHPYDVRIYTSKDLSHLAGFEEISANSLALFNRENFLEAMIQSIEQCALAALPVAATLPPLSVDSSLRIMR